MVKMDDIKLEKDEKIYVKNDKSLVKKGKLFSCFFAIVL